MRFILVTIDKYGKGMLHNPNPPNTVMPINVPRLMLFFRIIMPTTCNTHRIKRRIHSRVIYGINNHFNSLNLE